MQQIKAKSVERKDGVSAKSGKPYTRYTVMGEDGSASSTFDSMAASIQAGDTIEAELEMNGKYTNLKAFKVVSSNGQTIQEIFPGSTPVRSNKDKEISIAVAVKAVTELAGSNVIPKEHPLVTAVTSWCTDQLRQYLSRGVTNTPKTENKATGPQPGSTFPHEKVDTQSLLNSIKDRMHFTTDNSALLWLKQNKIPQERIDGEPDAVYRELKTKMGWV